MTETIEIKSLVPILLVEAIEPSLPFWAALGFTVTTAVPQASPYVFAIVACGGIEVMLQTHASAAEDLATSVPAAGAGTVYIRVGALGPVLAALGAVEIAVARRTTFYGADEVFVREPGGHLIGLAAFA